MSEFGKGYAYCLGLFLAHAERNRTPLKQDDDDSLWYYAAADHLFDIQIPEALPDDKKREVSAWVAKMIDYRYRYEIPRKERSEHLDTAKRFLLEWDAICGIDCEKGGYE